jgi:hypothetical protein
MGSARPSDEDVLIVMDSRELASAAVQGHNRMFETSDEGTSFYVPTDDPTDEELE